MPHSLRAKLSGLRYKGILEDKDYKRLCHALDLEKAEQEPKTGYWIDIGSGQECSECHEIQYGYDNFRRFCASCGIRMIEPKKSEVKKNDET